MTAAHGERPATFSELVAREIDKARGGRRMSQAALARAIGKSEMWMSLRLRGKQPIDLNDLEAIATALDMEVADLIPKITKVTVNVNYQDRHHPATQHVARVTPHRPITGARPDATRPGSPLGERHRRPVSKRPANRPVAA